MNLKKWLVFCLLCVSIFSMQAQVLQEEPPKLETPSFPKNSIGVYYGYFSNQQFIVLLSDVFEGAFTTLPSDSINTKYKMQGTFGIDYKRQVSKRVSVGIDYNYTHIRVNKKNFSDNTDDIENKYNFHTIGFLLNIKYLQKKKFSLYGGLLAGVSIIHVRSTKDVEAVEYKDGGIRPNWHVNLLGVEVGKKVSGFVELGIGNRGVLNAGIRTHF